MRKLLAALVGEPDGFAAGAFRQTESNCSASGLTSAGSSVRTPFSKLRLRSRDLLRPLRGSVATLLRATRRLRRGRILRPHPGTRQIGRAEIRLSSVNDDTLEMHSRTKHSFHSTPKIRIAVEVIPPVWLGLLRPLRGSVAMLPRATRRLRRGRIRILRMDEPHLDPTLHHSVQHLQERHHLPPARHSACASAIPSLRSALTTFGGYRIDIHVLDVCGGDPQSLHRLRHNPADDGGVDVAIGEKGGRGINNSADEEQSFPDRQ